MRRIQLQKKQVLRILLVEKEKFLLRYQDLKDQIVVVHEVEMGSQREVTVFAWCDFMADILDHVVKLSKGAAKPSRVWVLAGPQANRASCDAVTEKFKNHPNLQIPTDANKNLTITVETGEALKLEDRDADGKFFMARSFVGKKIASKKVPELPIQELAYLEEISTGNRVLSAIVTAKSATECLTYLKRTEAGLNDTRILWKEKISPAKSPSGKKSTTYRIDVDHCMAIFIGDGQKIACQAEGENVCIVLYHPKLQVVVVGEVAATPTFANRNAVRECVEMMVKLCAQHPYMVHAVECHLGREFLGKRLNALRAEFLKIIKEYAIYFQNPRNLKNLKDIQSARFLLSLKNDSLEILRAEEKNEKNKNPKKLLGKTIAPVQVYDLMDGSTRTEKPANIVEWKSFRPKSLEVLPCSIVEVVAGNAAHLRLRKNFVVLSKYDENDCLLRVLQIPTIDFLEYCASDNLTDYNEILIQKFSGKIATKTMSARRFPNIFRLHFQEKDDLAKNALDKYQKAFDSYITDAKSRNEGADLAGLVGPNLSTFKSSSRYLQLKVDATDFKFEYGKKLGESMSFDFCDAPDDPADAPSFYLKNGFAMEPFLKDKGKDQ